MIIVWRVTEDCNLACPFCSFDRRVERPRQNTSVESVQRFGRVLAEFRRSTGTDVLVSWIGGEPLLWAPLEALTRQFTREFGLRISTTTNGTTLKSPATRRHLIEAYSELTVSIDAIGGDHDRLRGWRGGYATLEESVRNLANERSAAGSPLKLRANVVLMRDTFDQFPALCERIASWGIDEVTFNQLGGNDRPEFFTRNRLQPEQADWLADNFARLEAELRCAGVVLRGSAGYIGRIRSSTLDARIAVADCHPGEEFLFVDETGRIAPCSFTPAQYGIPLDEITDVTGLMALSACFRNRRAVKRAAACEDCQSTYVFEKFSAR